MSVVDAVAKPLLRGWLHAICFFLALPTAVWVVVGAPTTKARAGAVVYGFGLVALFGVSGAYHRGRWRPAWRMRMKRLDHATIFVMIAGSYTPICLLVLRGWSSIALLASVWVTATVGAVLSFLRGKRVELASNVLYIALGWSVLLAGPQLLRNLPTSDLALLVAGGALFTIGAVTLAVRWPDPHPRVLGYHEV
ncbi:MAG: hemolysin III family protein, partial [Actinomycetota bacterium]|nr:hemolysin III family protein [Actinomycetota bacterium]